MSFKLACRSVRVTWVSGLTEEEASGVLAWVIKLLLVALFQQQCKVLLGHCPWRALIIS